MEEVGVKQLKRDLSAYLRRVARGERLRVTLRGRPVAEIVSPTGTGEPSLETLADEGRVTLPSSPLPRKPPPLEHAAQSASELVLGERSAGR